MSKWQLQCGVTATGAILAGVGALLPSREQILILLIHLCNLEDWIVEIISTKIFGKQDGVLTQIGR